MVDTDLGEATIVYEDPDEGTVETTVENEHVAYFQDHWIVKTEERDGHDVVRRIPAQRVYYVERSVEEFEREATSVVDEFEREIETLRDAVRSFTGDLPTGLFGKDRTRERTETEVTRIDIQEGESDGVGDAGPEDAGPGDTGREDTSPGDAGSDGGDSREPDTGDDDT